MVRSPAGSAHAAVGAAQRSTSRRLVVAFVGLYLLAGLLTAVAGNPVGFVGAGRTAPPIPPSMIPPPRTSTQPLYLFPPEAGPTPSVTSGSNTYHAGAQAPTTACNPTCTYLTNSGARTTIQVVSQSVTGCLSYWIGDDSGANLWGQVGYYICNGSSLVAFYQIWNLASGAALTTGTTSVSTGYHTFSMYSQSGGTVWAFALDGVVFGTYDMGSSVSLGTYPVQAVSEEGLVSGPWVPAQVTFSAAIETLQTASTNPSGNGWYAPSSAFEPWGGCASDGTPNNAGGYTCWGIAGNLQDSTVPLNSLVVGGTRALLPSGTNLWSGISPDFTITTSPASVTMNAGGTGTSTVTVSGVSGFSGTVSLGATISPSTGLACSLSPASVVGSGTSTLSCTGNTAGSYTVTVTGTSGSLSHSATVTVNVSGGISLTVSFFLVGGGTGYSAPTFTYVQGGTTRTATLTTTATAYTVDPNSAWSVTNPLAGSSSGERWQTTQATSGTATASATIAFGYNHQFAVTFAYSVLDGGSGYSAPTVAYTAFGAGASTATGTAVWTDAGSSYAYPTSLPGSTTSESWRTNAGTGTVAAAGSPSASYYHQYSVTFGYTVTGGGSGYTTPSVTTMQFGAMTTVAVGVATWVDSGAAYALTNPLGGSTASERWIALVASGTITAAGSVSATYTHQVSVTFAYAVQGGGAGYSAPSVAYSSLGTSASTPTGSAVWADVSSRYTFTNPLTGSTSTAAWRTGAGTGTVTAAGTVAATYYYQFLVSFLVQVVNGPPPPSMPALTATLFGAATSVTAGGSSWVDANGSYAYPVSFAGSSGERWMSGNPSSGTVTLPTAITASYYHQYSLVFSYSVSGGGSGYSAPSVTYAALGAALTTTAGTTAWTDAGSAFTYASVLLGGSASERWMTGAPGGTATGTGTFTVTYIHQFWVDFSYTIKGGGTGYSAPNVTYSNLSASVNVLATGSWIWANAGAPYAYQNPLPGSTSTDSWQTNNGVGNIGSSTTYSATYRHQYKVRFKTTTTAGTVTPETPLVNVTVFGLNESLPADNVTWVDAGSTYGFPSVFYGPLPGERWITATPPSGIILGPTNITAAYQRQYYLAIQVNAPSGGSVSGTAGWYDEAAALQLTATAAAGWQFQGWIGSGNGSYTGAQATATVSMDAPVTETAVFYVGLTLSASSGGSLQYTYGGTSGWVPAANSQTLYLLPGTEVTVKAAPTWFYQLNGWSGAATGNPSTVVVVANTPQSLNAAFGLSLYSKADSLLGLAFVLILVLALLGARRHRRKKKALRLRAARMRAQAHAQSVR